MNFSPILLLILSFICVLLVVEARKQAPTGYDHALELRLQKSQGITVEDVDKEMSSKDIREHLTWRGEACEDCRSEEQMKTVLKDHIHSRTEASAKKYSDTSALLRKQRHARGGLGDNPIGNHPRRAAEEERRKRDSSRRRRNDPNDPLASLKNVLDAHGLKAHSISGEKDMNSFLEQQKQRRERSDKSNKFGGNNGDL